MIFEKPNPSEIAQAMQQNATPDTLFVVMVAENTPLDVAQLMTTLNETTCQYIGGIFPKLIFDNKLLDQGVTVSQLKGLRFILPTQNIIFDCYGAA